MNFVYNIHIILCFYYSYSHPESVNLLLSLTFTPGAMSSISKCAICNDSEDRGPTSTLTEKGSDAINQASKSRSDDIRTSPGEQVIKSAEKHIQTRNK